MANESVTIVQSPNSVTVTQSTNTTAAATSNPAAGLGGGGTIQGSLDITQNLDVDGSLETDALTINGVSLLETIQDAVGGMVTGNTETGITVSYEDSDGTLDFAVTSVTDENFTTADHAKLDAIEALADVTDTANVVSSLTAGTNITIASDGTISSADTQVTTEQIQDAVGSMLSGNTENGITVTYDDVSNEIDFTVASQTDENFTTADHTKLDGIETAATADQTASEIRALVESATDSNVFTDADHTKLNAIEASADVTDTTNVVAALTAGSNVTIAADGTVSSSFTDTNTTYTAGNGLTLTGTEFTHTDTSTQASSSNSGRTYIQSINVDGFGHITGLTTGTETVVNTDTNTQLSDEQVQDIVGAMLTGNTVSGITITYQDTDGTIDFSVASQTDENFTTADHSKLDGIATGADVTPSWVPSSDPTYATQSYVGTQISNLVDSAPSTLDTLNELAAALGDDANFSTTISNSIGTKLALAGGTMSGDINMGTNNITNVGNVDGRDVSADGTKLDGIEASADVTDTTNVVAALTAGSNVTIAADGTVSSSFTDTNTTYTAGNGLTLTGTEFTHTDTSTQASSSNSGRTYIQSINVDGFGHITGLTTGTETVVNTDTNTQLSDEQVQDIVGAMVSSNTESGIAVTYDDTGGKLNLTVASQTDQNFTNADHTKLDGIESGATADQTAAEIRSLVESATDSNVFTDADHTKLNAIEASADVTDTTNVVAALTAGSNVTIAADGTVSSSFTDTNTTYTAGNGLTLTGTEFTHTDTSTQASSSNSGRTYIQSINVDGFGHITGLTTGTETVVNTDTNTQLSDEQVQDIVGAMVSSNTESGIAVTYDDTGGKLNLTVASQTDQNFTNADHTKLDGIESGATADQTAAEIRALVESATDSNVFTDADHTKLNAIEASADVTDTTNVVAALTAGSNVTIAADGTVSSSFTDTNTTYTAGNGLTLTGTEFTHTDTSTQASSSNSGRTYIQSINVDGFGHITGLTTGTETVVNTDTNTQLSDEQVQDIVGAMLTGNTVSGITITYQDTDGTIDFSVASQTDENFTTADHSKLDGIATGADVTPSWVPSSDPTYATQSYVGTQISNLVDSAPSTLDTLNELAAALGDDANFSTTISNSIGTKLALAGGTMSGDINMGTNNITNVGNVDGRDVSADGTKLDGIEASADVTDTTNVVAALTAGSNVTIAADGTVSSSFTDTNTTYTAGNGLTLTGTEFTHTDTSTQASSSNSGRTYIQSINVDGFGHITGLTTGTETVVNTDTNTQLSDEQVQDIVGAMVSSNTESGIAVTYDDTGGKLNLTVASSD